MKRYAHFLIRGTVSGGLVPACGSDSYLVLRGWSRYHVLDIHNHARNHAHRGFVAADILSGHTLREAKPIRRVVITPPSQEGLDS